MSKRRVIFLYGDLFEFTDVFFRPTISPTMVGDGPQGPNTKMFTTGRLELAIRQGQRPYVVCSGKEKPDAVDQWWVDLLAHRKDHPRAYFALPRHEISNQGLENDPHTVEMHPWLCLFRDVVSMNLPSYIRDANDAINHLVAHGGFTDGRGFPKTRVPS